MSNLNLRCWHPSFPHVVKIPDDGSMSRTYEVIEWAALQGYNKMGQQTDYHMDMLGGTSGYTLFYFKDASKALITKLTWGGDIVHS